MVRHRGRHMAIYKCDEPSSPVRKSSSPWFHLNIYLLCVSMIHYFLDVNREGRTQVAKESSRRAESDFTVPKKLLINGSSMPLLRKKEKFFSSLGFFSPIFWILPYVKMV